MRTPLPGRSASAASAVPVVVREHGFTLIELCVVLCLMALLAGLAMPAMNSAFNEQSMRSDSHQFSVMVKTAMLKCDEQNRSYVIDLAGKSIMLEPAKVDGPLPDDRIAYPALQLHDNREPDPAPPAEDVTSGLTLANTFALPDAQKKGAWESVPAIRWVFQPGGLCPLPRVRVSRGSAWIEMSFNALTGNVEDEASYIP